MRTAIFTALVALAIGVAARDDRICMSSLPPSFSILTFFRDTYIAVNHPDSPDWCTTAKWEHNCKHYSPKTSIILSSLCEAGDFDGSNPNNTTRVVCSVSTGATNQLTLITQFVSLGFFLFLFGVFVCDGC